MGIPSTKIHREVSTESDPWREDVKGDKSDYRDLSLTNELTNELLMSGNLVCSTSVSVIEKTILT